MIPYRPKEAREFPPNFSQAALAKKGKGSKIRLKIVDGEVKTGGDMNFPNDRDQEFYVYDIVFPSNGKHMEWKLKTTHHIADQMAQLNVQPGDTILLTYLGETLKTNYGMKSKYQVEKVQSETQEESVDLEEVEATMTEDGTSDGTSDELDEVSIQDIPLE